MILALAALALCVWVYLLTARGGFWRAAQRDDDWPLLPDPSAWPAVVAIIPARDEAEGVGRCVASLARQDYPGRLSIILVDDESSDGTADVARAAVKFEGARAAIEIVAGAPRPPGWSGKVWAMEQGLRAALAAAEKPDHFLFCDADIEFAPEALRALARYASANECALVSLMARLRCESFAERALIPAYVFFFQMLYPFAWVADPARRVAGAAGGCMFAERAAIEAAGAFESLRGALIDDCALAAAMKPRGKIALALTTRAVSLRAYPRIRDIGAMVARSAYTQLNYSPALLIGVTVAMALIFVAPPIIAFFGPIVAALLGLFSWIAMALAFRPMLRFYGRNTSWGLALPLIALVYLAFTLESAYLYVSGRGGRWKGRLQAARAGGGEKR